MERLTHPRSSGIKTGYWSPNKKDELVERLAAYEDTGLTPEEIKALNANGKHQSTAGFRWRRGCRKPEKMFWLCENGVDFGSMVWLWEKRWHISPSDVGTLHENIVAWMPLPEPYQ
jgi:hypothetical protein